MKINCTNNINPVNLNFGKTVLNHTKIRMARQGTENVDFVEYDPKNRSDRHTINSIGLCWGTNPAESEHIRCLSSKFEMAGLDEEALPDTHFYGLEDMWGSPIAVAQVTSKKKHGINRTEIDYIQTAPDEKFSSQRKKYKGVGETLVAQILQKLTGKTEVVELTSLAENFWGESGLFVSETSDDIYPKRYIEQRHFDEYIEHVENKKSPKFSLWG